ncbi:MAG: DUF4160 domain-containing protein [Nevskia sp.]|nr:DUF4160 domain-containing protein [Nevskia sp.]
MPEISRFLGIVITMYFKDHNPPHFHVQYNDYRAQIAIATLGTIEGQLPPRVLSLVVEWASIHRDELMTNWTDLSTTGQFHKIEPLA